MLKVLAISLLSLFSNPREEARIKALYLHNFMRNMEWPTEKVDDKYVIAVVGDIYVVEQIKSLTNNKLINNREVVAYNYTSDIKMEDVNILFLAKSLSDLYPDFHKEAIPNSVLIVTEEKGLAQKGAAVNFINKGNKLTFELNTSTLEQSQIKASRAITETAKLIK